MCLSDHLLCTFRSSSCCIPGNRKRDASTSFSPGDRLTVRVPMLAFSSGSCAWASWPKPPLDSTHLKSYVLCLHFQVCHVELPAGSLVTFILFYYIFSPFCVVACFNWFLGLVFQVWYEMKNFGQRGSFALLRSYKKTKKTNWTNWIVCMHASRM
jgi:hypothetical protein